MIGIHANETHVLVCIRTIYSSENYTLYSSENARVYNVKGFSQAATHFAVCCSPMNSSDALLHNSLNLLEHTGVLFIYPVCEVTTIIQDLSVQDQFMQSAFKHQHSVYHYLKRLSLSTDSLRNSYVLDVFEA